MKGLLLKDIFLLRSYAKTLCFLILAYFVLGVAGNNAYFFAGMSGVICVMMVVTSFSYDNYAKWDKYGASLPVTRAEIVGAKYLLALFLVVIGALITMFMAAVFMLVHKKDLSEVFSMTFGTTVAAVFLVSVLLPCIYKFGAEKGRLALVAAALAVIPLIALFAVVIPKNAELSTVKALVIYSLPVVEMVGFYFSYKLSCRIYKNKEL